MLPVPYRDDRACQLGCPESLSETVGLRIHGPIPGFNRESKILRNTYVATDYTEQVAALFLVIIPRTMQCNGCFQGVYAA